MATSTRANITCGRINLTLNLLCKVSKKSLRNDKIKGDKDTMNKVFLVFALVICIAFSLTVVCTAVQQEFNGGFEREGLQENIPKGWYPTYWPSTIGHVKFSWERLAHSGHYSVSIEILNTHPSLIILNERIAYNWVRTFEPFEIGKTYEISGWVKTRDLKSPPFIVVQFWNMSQRKLIGLVMLKSDKGKELIGTNNWTSLKTKFKVPAGTDQVLVRAGISSPENINGKAWFDDIIVSPVSLPWFERVKRWFSFKGKNSSSTRGD